MRNIAALTALTLICAGCAAVPSGQPSAGVGVPGTASDMTDTRGLEGVLGSNEATLIRLFGKPRLDVVEPVGRKLQFIGAPCILDAYLYPDRQGREVVTHVDARRRDGAAVDRAACVAALQAK
ncbi:hypothetical protein [Novosphingopyxis iocasae]|uniref:hypothetical protein n=1 Tax=Novosphingopyxis iocasae TaxID=2762729 RepID=UPI001FEC4221|nr:hypothetical protein [Novosphingopyxis iocasae]